MHNIYIYIYIYILPNLANWKDQLELCLDHNGPVLCNLEKFEEIFLIFKTSPYLRYNLRWSFFQLQKVFDFICLLLTFLKLIIWHVLKILLEF